MRAKHTAGNPAPTPQSVTHDLDAFSGKHLFSLFDLTMMLV
jgi:hypothetical protein